MKTHGLKIAALGDVNIDIFLNIPYYPPAGGDGLAYEIEYRTGGSVTNTVIVLARLGMQTEMVTRTGTDPWADMALKTMTDEGVGIHYTTRDEKAGTGLIFLTVTPDGERTMFSYRGANVNMTPEVLDEDLFAQIDLLHISGYTFLRSPQKDAAWRSIELAEKFGVPVALDLGVEPAVALGDDLARLLGKLDLLVLGDNEAITIAAKSTLEEAMQSLLQTGVKTIGLKLGREGCIVATPERQVRLPGFKVETIDTTGAGDAFSAGMIFGRLHGLSLEARGILANTLGALTTTVWGGGASLLSLPQVYGFLQSQRNGTQPWDAQVDEALAALAEVM